MHRLSHRRRLLLALGASALLTVAVAAPAFANNTVTQDVTGGTRTAHIADANLTAVDFSHSQQDSNGNLTLTADDSTGSGAGWNVTVASSDMVYSGGNGGTDIPAANVSLGTPAAPSHTAGQAIDVTNGPLKVGTGGSLNSAVKVIGAAVDYGSGTYGQSLPLTVTIPADSRAGTYTGTLTVTITAGP